MAQLLRLAIMATALTDPSDPTTVTDVAVFDEAGKSIEQAAHLSIVPRDELVRDHLDERLKACGGNLSCAAEHLVRAQVDLALVVIVDLGSKPALVMVRLVESKGGAVLGSAIEQVAEVKDVWSVLRKSSFAVVDGACLHLGGRLIVETSPSEAAVSIASIERAAAKTFCLMPGSYEVIARHPGHLDASTRVLIERGRETRTGIHLDEDSTILSSPWLWAGVGVLAIGSITAYAMLSREFTFCLEKRNGACR